MNDYQGPERRFDAEKLAALQVKVEHLEKTVEKMDEKIDTLIAFMSEHKGGIKVLCIVASAGGLVGGILVKLLPFIASFK